MLVYGSHIYGSALYAFMQRSMLGSLLHSFGNQDESRFMRVYFASVILTCQKTRVLMFSSVCGVQEWTKFCQEKFGTGAAGFME